MFHCSTTVPSDKPVTVVFGFVEEVKTAEPETTLHVPEPVVGVFAVSVVELVFIHTV